MRKLVCLGALAWCLAMAGQAGAATQNAAASPTAQPAGGWAVGEGLTKDPTVRWGVLPNGMRYAIRRNATPPGEAAIRLRIDAGSLHESQNQLGIAHFVEHMIFNGTKNVPENEFIRRLEREGLRFGPDTNAYTSFDETVYMLDLPETDAGTVNTALNLLREGVDHALMLQSAIDAERPIILDEERSRATPQFRQAVDELAYMYGGQLLPNRFPIGTVDSIRTMNRDEFLRFYNAYYRPERATLVAVGDFNVDEMERRIRQHFGSWRGEGPAGADPFEGRPAQRRAAADIFVDPGVTSRVSLSWVRPVSTAADSRERRRQEVLHDIAIGALNRRIERIAATGNPAPFIGGSAARSELAETSDSTTIAVATQPGQWRPALNAIDQEQRRLVQFGLTQPELEREIANRRTALTQAVAGAETRTSGAIAMGILGNLNRERATTGPQASLQLFEEAVRGLTLERVNAAIPDLFAGSGPLLYMTSPVPVEGEREALLLSYLESTRVAVSAPQVQQRLAFPYTDFGPAGTVAERREFADIGATGVRFANGVRLTVKPTQFRDNEISVAVRVGDGLLDLTGERAPLANLLPLGAFQLGGLGRISAEELQEALTGKAVQTNFTIAEDAFVLSGTTRPDDFTTQLQVLAAYVSDPAWQPTGYDRVKGIFPQILAGSESTPSGVWSVQGPSLLRGGDRRWGLPTAAETSASTIADARALVAPSLANDPIEIIIAGDVTVEQAIAQVAATFGALPPRQGERAAATPLAFPAGNAEPVRLAHRGRDDQSMAFVGWPTAGFHENRAEARALGVLASVFQLRLNERIREQGGISYAPSASHQPSSVFNHGVFAAQVMAPTDALGRFLSEAQAIAADLAARPISADELLRARQPMLEAVQRSRGSSNAWWLGALGQLQTDPRVLETLNSQVRDIEAVTPAELQRLAQRTLVPGKAFKAVVVPQARPAQ